VRAQLRKTDVAHESAVSAQHVGDIPLAAPAHDLIIAATARAAARIVLTIDASGFADLPGLAVRSP